MHPIHYEILSKLKGVPQYPLSKLVDSDKIQRGVSPDYKSAYIVNKLTIEKYKLEKSKLKPTLTGGKQVHRYSISSDELFVLYNKRDDDFSQIPNICKYIDLFRDDPSAANDDAFARLQFRGTDDAQNSHVYAWIEAEYENVANGREASSLIFATSWDTGSATQFLPFMALNTGNDKRVRMV